jgi:hypothetical protein
VPRLKRERKGCTHSILHVFKIKTEGTDAQIGTCACECAAAHGRASGLQGGSHAYASFNSTELAGRDRCLRRTRAVLPARQDAGLRPGRLLVRAMRRLLPALLGATPLLSSLALALLTRTHRGRPLAASFTKGWISPVPGLRQAIRARGSEIWITLWSSASSSWRCPRRRCVLKPE